MTYPAEAYARAFLDVWETSSSEQRAKIRKRFVQTLYKNGDIHKSEAILKVIQRTLVHKQGGREITLEFARPMYPEALKDLRHQFKKEDHITMTINPELIAGVRVTIDGHRELDATFARKIKKLFT